MLTKRLIVCLDVRDGVVVKGVQFQGHEILGDIETLAWRYREAGADELVFYDITASAEGRTVSTEWVGRLGRILDIPFCVAGGIRTVEQARAVLNAGADKISINSPAHNDPELIDRLATAFGRQCVVLGVDSKTTADGTWVCWRYTGNEATAETTHKRTLDWVQEAQQRGAGEIVLNTMNTDGTKRGYDLEQLRAVRERLQIPLVASGGAGTMPHFAEVFEQTGVDAALAAGVFHRGEIEMDALKSYLDKRGIPIRPRPRAEMPEAAAPAQ